MNWENPRNILQIYGLDIGDLIGLSEFRELGIGTIYTMGYSRYDLGKFHVNFDVLFIDTSHCYIL